MTALFAPAVVADLRFRSRHVRRTVAAYVEEKLTELGWVTAPINFGATPVTFMEAQPEENGKTIASNTVVVTLGDIGVDLLQELGGGYYEVLMPLFVDIYGDTSATAQTIGDDIKEQISRNVIIPVYNWNTDVPVKTSSTIEFDMVTGPEKPPSAATAQDFRKFWRVVKAEAHVFYEPTIG